MALADVLQEVRSHTTLKEAMEAALVETKQHPFLVPGSTIRASSFADICVREEVLCAVYEVMTSEIIKPDLQMIFAHGTALHSILQSNVLPRLGDVLYGAWKCCECGRVHGNLEGFDAETIIPRPKKCNNAKCRSRKTGVLDFKYEEANLFSPEYRITGHPDGFIKLPGRDGFGLLEAKSCSAGKARQVRSCPDMGHVVQAHIYLWLTGLKWTLILYWEKGANGLDALIEHYIDRDEDTIDQIKATAKSVWTLLDPWWKACEDAKKKGLPRPPPPPLPERICASRGCERAAACGVADICFKE